MNIRITRKGFTNGGGEYIRPLPITVIGYGKQNLRQKIQPYFMDGKIIDIKGLVRELSGTLSKRSTGELLYYYSTDEFNFSL